MFPRGLSTQRSNLPLNPIPTASLLTAATHLATTPGPTSLPGGLKINPLTRILSNYDHGPPPYPRFSH